MNAERLHAVVKALLADIQKLGLKETLNNMVVNLQNMVNQPNQPSFQQSVGSYRDTLRGQLSVAAANDFSPTWKQIVEEIGGSGLIGRELAERIEAAFSQNSITPSIALERIQIIQREINAFIEAIEAVDSSFSVLRIGSEALLPGECEISVLIPRHFVSNELKRFGLELEKLNKIFGVFSELVTGTRPGFQIRTISSSDLSIYLEAHPHVCAAIALSIERVVALYKKLLEIRKLKNELKAQGLGDRELQGVERHANNIMDGGIAEIVADLERRYLSDMDAGRHNEISIELRHSLKKIADRIDRGVNIEIRMSRPTSLDSGTDGRTGPSDDEKSYQTISAASKNMQFLKLGGDPILGLEEGDESGSDAMGD